MRRINRVHRELDSVEDIVEDIRDRSTEKGLLSAEVENDRQDLERLMLLVPFIKRDAYERYLLIYHFVKKVSDIWSAFLFWTVLISLASTGITYYLVLVTLEFNHSKAQLWGFVLAVLLEAALFIFPVACLVHANTHVDHILKNLLLGDRDTWREFTESAPLYWCIIGIPITRNVLFAYYSAAGTAAPVIFGLVLQFWNKVPFLKN